MKAQAAAIVTAVIAVPYRLAFIAVTLLRCGGTPAKLAKIAAITMIRAP
jgi:hypothetical protein